MQFIEPPSSRHELPLSNARVQLQRAFAELRAANSAQHTAVMHAAGCVAHYVGPRSPAHVEAGSNLYQALAADLEDIDAAAMLCKQLLWRELGEDLAHARLAEQGCQAVNPTTLLRAAVDAGATECELRFTQHDHALHLTLVVGCEDDSSAITAAVRLLVAANVVFKVERRQQ